MAAVVALRNMAYARVNWGRWVVDCQNPFCGSALMLRPGVPAFECWDCGTEQGVSWPSNWNDIQRLLLPRAPKFRNWHPGETLHDLFMENIEHGAYNPMLELAEETTPLMLITGDRITLDATPQIGR